MPRAVVRLPPGSKNTSGKWMPGGETAEVVAERIEPALWEDLEINLVFQ